VGPGCVPAPAAPAASSSKQVSNSSSGQLTVVHKEHDVLAGGRAVPAGATGGCAQPPRAAVLGWPADHHLMSPTRPTSPSAPPRLPLLLQLALHQQLRLQRGSLRREVDGRGQQRARLGRPRQRVRQDHRLAHARRACSAVQWILGRCSVVSWQVAIRLAACAMAQQQKTRCSKAVGAVRCRPAQPATHRPAAAGVGPPGTCPAARLSAPAGSTRAHPSASCLGKR
jgi:hypothetical protein